MRILPSRSLIHVQALAGPQKQRQAQCKTLPVERCESHALGPALLSLSHRSHVAARPCNTGLLTQILLSIHQTALWLPSHAMLGGRLRSCYLTLCHAQGVFTGGLAHANDLVSSGRAAAGEFRLLSGYSLWPERALQREIEAGHWWLVAASREFLLSFVQGACPLLALMLLHHDARIPSMWIAACHAPLLESLAHPPAAC